MDGTAVFCDSSPSWSAAAGMPSRLFSCPIDPPISMHRNRYSKTCLKVSSGRKSWTNKRAANICCAVSLVVLALTCGGCKSMLPESWNLDHLRDSRVGDIEDRLDREKPIVASPVR